MNAPRAALHRVLSDGPVTWLLTGDSITEGWGLGRPELGYAGRFEAYLRSSAGPVRAQDVVRNSGVAGATVGEALWDFGARVERHRADLVTILFGMNDAGWGIAGIDRFQNGLEKFVERVIGLGGLPILQTPYPVGHGGEGTHAALPAYVDVIRKLADERQLLLVDHFAHWQDLPGRFDWYADPWHVDERGHEELAARLIATVLADPDPLSTSRDVAAYRRAKQEDDGGRRQPRDRKRCPR
ncbi:MAG: GDSL-type esterase/lipase family protein [Propionibacteriaceae bacterium]|nr:GDSL-type esterase/lipase family protein [Propionibacteriaceae bacterium]